jgi:hypothetical protein
MSVLFNKRKDAYSSPTPRPAFFGLVAGVIVLLIVLATVMFGGSLNRAQSNEWGCLYGGGIGESKALKETVAPGKSGGFTIFDKFKTLPSGDRIYAIDNDPATADLGGQPIIVPAKGSNAEGSGVVPVVVPVQARFTINERACELYNNYLKGKPGPIDWNGEAKGVWPTFLNLQFNQVLITAARSEISNRSYVELYTDFSQYGAYQDAISAKLTAALNKSLGGDFFCGPSYVFDGVADGNVESCPPIEIVIKEIRPQDAQFLDNLQKIVANEEQQTVIKSTSATEIAKANSARDTAVAKSTSDAETRIAKSNAEAEAALAEIENSRQVKLAEALANVEIAQAFAAVAEAETANKVTRVAAETAFCERLATAGVDCAQYFQAQNWKPTIIMGDGATPLVNVGG